MKTASRVRVSGGWLLVASAAAFVAFIALPLIAIFARVLPLPGLAPTLTRPIVLDALRLSMTTSLLALGFALLIGTPFAYLMARRDFRGKGLVDSIVELPMVLPPAVAGIGLLMAFGRRGLLGAPLDALGVSVAFTTLAVVLAQAFVSAPF